MPRRQFGNDANSPARRSDVQDGARSVAVRSRIVLAVDDLAAGKSAGRPRACCAWAAPWSIFIASPSTRFPNGSRSTSTTRSMRCMAASSCGCSMPITTNMAFSRSSCSTARAASSPPCFAPPSGPAARRSKPSCAACCAPSAPTGRSTEILLRGRQPLLRSRGSRLVSRQRPRLHPRRRADRDIAPAHRRPRGQREGALRGRAERRQGPPLQGVLRRRRKLEPRRAHHRPRRGRRGGARHALHRHQSETDATLARSMRMSIAGAARPKTTSNPGRRIWRRIARHAPRPRPISFGCSCTPAPTG